MSSKINFPDSPDSDDASRREALRPHGPPWAALLAIALAVCFEFGYVYHFRYRFQDSTYSLSEIKRNLITSAAPRDDVAIFGNSRFYHIDPTRLREVFGPHARITNYAWAWCGVEIYEAMLHSMINAGRPPRVLLVDGNPELFGDPSTAVSIAGQLMNQSRYDQTAPFRPALHVELALHLWPSAWKTIAHYLTPPSIQYGPRVGKGIERLIDDHRLPKPRINFDQIVGHWQRDGWLQFAAERVAPMEEFRQSEKPSEPYVLYRNPRVLKAYERFLNLARQHHIQVIMLPVPSNPYMYEKYQQNGVFAAYDAWLDQMEKKYPLFHALTPRQLTWPNLLGDSAHLNQAGIQRHMNLIVNLLENQTTATQ